MLPTTPSSPTLDDVFSNEENTSNIIVDADVIEAVKENIQPLQKGRRATALSAIFSTPHAQRDALLSRQRARFRLQVIQALEDDDEDENGGDLLDVYSRFVAWTLESYPQGQSADSGLLELLEEATRKLKDEQSCKQDPRYLKLWTLYAGYVDKPTVIYAYLLANEIGTDLAQLYEEYAYVLERDGRRREADEIYSLGIARRVEPLDHLKKRYADYQRRMVAAPLPAAPSPPRPMGNPTIGRRTVLGESLTSQPRRPTATHTPAPAQDVFTAPQPNARLQIFVDPTGEEAQKAEGNAWPDVGTRGSRTKENTAEVRKMGDGQLPGSRRAQRSVSGPASRIVPFREPPASGAFVPFRDEGDASAMPPPPPPAPASSRRVVPASTPRVTPFRDDEPPATPRPAFTPYKDKTAEETPARATTISTPMSLAPRAKKGASTSEAEALRRDPFKNYDVPPEGM